MVKAININFEAIEAMLYYWHTLKDRQKVPEKFIYDIAEMPGLKDIYDEDFNAESVRRVLSAIKNREVFSSHSEKEARFWNNNLWMMEDLDYTNAMVQPIKKLNLDDLIENIELDVIFAPFHFDDYIIKGNKLIINFFNIKPDQDLKAFIKEKLTEVITK